MKFFHPGIIVCALLMMCTFPCCKQADRPWTDDSLPGADDICYDDINSGSSVLAVYWNPYPAMKAGAKSFTAQLVKNEKEYGGDIYSSLSTTYSVEGLDYPGRAVFSGLRSGAKYHVRIRANYEGGRHSPWGFLQDNERSRTGVVKVGTGLVADPVSLLKDTEARLVLATSSTLSFSFSSTGFIEADTDAERKYDIALYRDEACTDLVVSWSIFPGCGTAYSASEKPCFLFTGLEPSTKYWFKAVDVTETPSPSNVVEGVTTPFTNVTVPASAQAGDILLAEDFSELIWGGSVLCNERAAGYSSKVRNNAPVFEKASGENPVGGQYQFYLVGIGQDMQLFGTLYSAIPASRLADWAYISEDNNTAMMCAQAGHVKCGTGAGLAEIVTPELNCLTGSAKVRVSFVAQRLSEKDGSDLIVEVLRGSSRDVKYAITVPATGRIPALQTKVAGSTYTSPFSVDIADVRPGDRIAIGGDLSKKTGYARFFIDEIVIRLISYND